MSNERAITLTKIGFEAECPAIPDGADPWERQEINRQWAAAIHDIDEAIVRLANLRAELVEHGMTSPNPSANDVQKAAVGLARATTLIHLVHSCEHRIADPWRHPSQPA